jgi:hypothetical protein
VGNYRAVSTAPHVEDGSDRRRTAHGPDGYAPDSPAPVPQTGYARPVFIRVRSQSIISSTIRSPSTGSW